MAGVAGARTITGMTSTAVPAVLPELLALLAENPDGLHVWGGGSGDELHGAIVRTHPALLDALAAEAAAAARQPGGDVWQEDADEFAGVVVHLGSRGRRVRAAVSRGDGLDEDALHLLPFATVFDAPATQTAVAVRFLAPPSLGAAGRQAYRRLRENNVPREDALWCAAEVAAYPTGGPSR